MKSAKEIITIVLVVAVFIGVAAAFSFTGTKNGGYNYVELEINPKIEFLTDGKENVISVYPINDDAKELIIGEQFEGLKIDEAVKKYLTIATNLNYLDVDRDDNVVKLTCVSGLTKALEVKLYREINSYLVKNEIMGVVIENTDDLQEFKQAKKLGVSNDKYSLIEAVNRLNSNEKKEDLKKLSEKKLLEKIKLLHENVKPIVQTATEAELNNKSKLINLNKAKIENHKNKITFKSTSKFKESYVKNKKLNASKYEKNFDAESLKWKEERTNLEMA